MQSYEYGNGLTTSAEKLLITRPSSMFQSNTAQRRYNRLGTSLNALTSSGPEASISASKYQPTYSRIVPSPYSTLSPQASLKNKNQNIVDDIFFQSQIRHAPQSLAPGFGGLAPLSGSPFGASIIPQFGGTGGAGTVNGGPGQALFNGLGFFL